MVDAVTKKTVAAIPQSKTKAGPRDGDLWVARLKEEYQSLIKVYFYWHTEILKGSSSQEKRIIVYHFELRVPIPLFWLQLTNLSLEIIQKNFTEHTNCTYRKRAES